MATSSIRELDRRLVQIARRVRVLGTLTWPASVEAPFLEAWRRGAPVLPAPPPPRPPPLHEIEPPLHEIVQRVDRAHPAGAFLHRTARGYLQAISLLHTAGTPSFTEASRALYGAPGDRMVPGAPTPLEEARHLIAATEALDGLPPDRHLPATDAAQRLSELVAPHFARPLPVELDPDLGSLAAAGSRRIRLREGMHYSEAQIDQLLHHEALVHTATKRNGQRQPLLSSLGLSSPRTVAAQEGLATLAELITNSMDLLRLRRIALRVEAVAAALSGADFVEVFTLLLEAGQPEVEAYRSAMRVFRGGDVRGRIVFTKDVVYLSGLRQVHTFLLAALREHRRELPQRMFVGRLTPGDVVALDALFDEGALEPAAVVPPWIARCDHLAASLSWTVFGHQVPLDRIALEDFLPEA